MRRTLMARIYWVDIPNPGTDEYDGWSWVNVAQVKTKKEAFAILEERWGIPKKYAKVFVTRGEE
jgi:hypothetical protein